MIIFNPNLHHRYSPYSGACRCLPCHLPMQGQSHACCPSCEEDDLFREVVEVAARQDACHQAVEVADEHQNCHCLVVAAACLDA